MFKFRESKASESAVDFLYRQKWNEVWEGKERLIACVEASIVRNQCVAIYPKGAHKAKAVEDAEQSKCLLLCVIDYYEKQLAELHEMWEQNHEKLEECANLRPDRWRDSHAIIEIAVKNFLKK